MHTFFYFEGAVISSVDLCLSESDCYLTSIELAYTIGCEPADILWSSGTDWSCIWA